MALELLLDDFFLNMPVYPSGLGFHHGLGWARLVPDDPKHAAGHDSLLVMGILCPNMSCFLDINFWSSLWSLPHSPCQRFLPICQGRRALDRVVGCSQGPHVFILFVPCHHCPVTWNGQGVFLEKE